MPLDQIDVDTDELPAEYRSQTPVPKQENPAEMSFIEHLDVLRKHLVRSAIVVVAITIGVAFTINFFFDSVIMAPTQGEFITYKVLCDLSELLNSSALCIELKEQELYNFKITGQFLMHIRTSLTLGIILAFPFTIYQIWVFIRPALHGTEKKVTSGIVFFCSFFFFIGVGFAYYFVIPLSYNFFVNYSISSAIQNNFNISTYISMFVDITLACGIMFQLPIFVYILSKLGIVGPDLLKAYRKHAYVAILFLSAILTPADIMSMILLALPLLLLYELSIFVSKAVETNRLKEA